MSGYRGFASKAEYEAYYSDYEQYKHELQSMEDYAKEAEQERAAMEAYVKEAEQERLDRSERNVMSVVDTKACNLTEAEIVHLITYHGYSLSESGTRVNGDRIERINYLHRRLKAFQEPDAKPVTEAKPEAGTAPASTSVQAAPGEVVAPNGWGA